MSTIYGNMVGGAGLAQSYIIEDSDGKQLTAVMVDKDTTFDATENDIREGKVAATEKGVVTGTKVIPAYHTTQGAQIIPSGSTVMITTLKSMDLYDYTKLQAILCEFNTTIEDSVFAVKVSIDNHVYNVLSTESLSDVVKNASDKTIEFGVTNETDNPQVLRYFTYKEVM